ncbi:MAG: hypothetical protein US55_C0026G0011 [Candidatus Levybacteria bacterium GW2011_GWC2_37_7]|nr:MAG: hypothetical protein US55_C0026G0011 [Candidatus Levybacteria bacterium GW2011_GWC2_37_7]
MLSKSHPIILFIDRFGFSVYQDALANIPKFSFTPDLVANLDVISKDQFVNLIGTFIQVNKMVPSSLAVILSDNVIYVKDLVSPAPKLTSTQGLETDAVDDKEHEDEVQIFLENVPFEEVLAKVIKVGNINRAVAVNKDLAMTIADTFSSKGFSVEAIAPGFMYGQSANFTVLASGTGISYQWYMNDVIIDGATSNLLSKTNILISSGHSFSISSLCFFNSARTSSLQFPNSTNLINSSLA